MFPGTAEPFGTRTRATPTTTPAAHHHSVLAWIAAMQGKEQDCRDVM